MKPEFPPGDTEAADEDNISPEVRALNFTPIDARHLSSLPLIRARVLNLLKVSKNQIHPANNLIVTIVRILRLTIISSILYTKIPTGI